MSDSKISIGQAVDQIISALTTCDQADQEAILRIVCTHLKIPLGQAEEQVRSIQKPNTSVTENNNADSHAASKFTGVIDIKSFKQEKQPKSARQMACIVAFYLQELVPETERKTEIGTDELEKYFKQANFELPKALEQLLKDCKKAGYFDSGSRGNYKLTRVGYNLVAHSLPSKS